MNNFLKEKNDISSWIMSQSMSDNIANQINKTSVRLKKISKLANWVVSAPLANRAFWKVGVFLCSSIFFPENSETKRKSAIKSYVDWKKALLNTDSFKSYANIAKNEFVIGLKEIQDENVNFFSQLKNFWSTEELFSFVYCHELGHILQKNVPPQEQGTELDRMAKPLPSLMQSGLDGKKLEQFFLSLDVLIKTGAESDNAKYAQFFQEAGYTMHSLFRENFADVFSVLLLGQRALNLDKFKNALIKCRKNEAAPDSGDREGCPYILDHCTVDALESISIVLKKINKEYSKLSIDESMEVAKYCTLIGVCKTLVRLMKEPIMDEFINKPESLSLIFGDTANGCSLPLILNQVLNLCIPKSLRCDNETFSQWLQLPSLGSKIGSKTASKVALK